ncbi:Phosphoribosylanthranilate isomerase [hydrothermal vent metagenome]|uniref:phosphoribosylanthranilate isomerase n=1 Tax=hydrothermal vent metagenome TaxID=652676 RepID=A0A3B1AEN6_9ZZZZ
MNSQTKNQTRTRVKICGITRIEDADAAVRAGVDALGLVFYAASPRSVSAGKAADIVADLPPFVTTVGLFVDADKQGVDDVLAQVPLDCLQFHGAESAEYCEQFKRPYIKAIRVNEQTDLRSEVERFASAQALLLDTYVKDTPGGTGQTFNWQLIPKQPGKPIILAGGLNSENVGDAIKVVSPYAVDVSGGVEASKGIKDHDKIKQFIHEVQCIGTNE